MYHIKLSFTFSGTASLREIFLRTLRLFVTLNCYLITMQIVHLTFFLFLCFSFSSLHAQDYSIKVISYNIRYPNPGDGDNVWDYRRPLVASILQFHEADLIGVQEAHRRQLEEITTDVPGFGWFGVCRDDGLDNPQPDNEFSAIIYRLDRFDRLDGNTFWLSETPDEVSKGWDAAFPRIVTWAKFKDKQTGKIFFHFNTHFDHMGVTARNESAKLILKKIESIAGNLPVILTGDFNCGENEAPYQTITSPVSYHLSDAMKISKTKHHGPSTTFAGDFRISGLIDHRIDFLFVNNNVDVLRHAILADNWNGVLASDHLPVLAEIIIR